MFYKVVGKLYMYIYIQILNLINRWSTLSQPHKTQKHEKIIFFLITTCKQKTEKN